MSNNPSPTQFYDEGERLPDTLPDSPFPLFKEWYDQAWQERLTPNANSMCIASTHQDGGPDARIVLCKSINVEQGSIMFYTNYHGQKGQQLEASPAASAAIHWDFYERQVRIRGQVVKATEEESDAYFASRAIESRLGSWISEQSQPIESREALLEKVTDIIDELGIDASDLMDGKKITIPRPPHWGGYHLHAHTIELWSAGTGRIHDRARWTRSIDVVDSKVTTGPWSSTRLQP